MNGTQKTKCSNRDQRPGELVASEDGRKLQARAWAEILEVLKKDCPNVTNILDDGFA